MIHVLYVDDEKGLLDVGKIFLEEDGLFSVDTITSAPAALALMAKKNYDAIISDYQMPGMDGVAFLKKVRDAKNSIPFILFTGRGREEIVIQALNEGADFYLQKGGDPVPQFAELAHKVRQAVQQRQAEVSIRDHERREQQIINFLPDATLAIDTNGVVIAWNKAIEEMTGVPANRILGKGDYEYAVPFYGERRPILIDLMFASEEEVRTRYSQIIRDGTMLAAETSLPRVKGNPRTLWGKASLLYDQNGKVVGAIEAIRDITARKTAEAELIKARDALEERVDRRTADLYAANIQLHKEIETRKLIDAALEESEERFRALIERAPEAILLFDMDLDRYIEANAKAGDLFGCSREKLLRDGPQQFYTPEQPDGQPFRESVTGHREQALAGKELVFERRIRNGRGEDRTIEVRLVGLPAHNRRLIRSSYIDITQRKRVEDTLRQSEGRYRAIVEQDYRSILDNIQDVFYRTDGKGNLILFSPSGLMLLGYTETDEILGRPASDFYANPDERDAFLTLLKKEGSVSNREVTLRRKDGSLVTVSTSSHVRYDASGRYAGAEGIFRDITGLKQVQEELRESEEQYRVLVSHIQDGVFLSQDGLLLYRNEALAAMIGYTIEEVTGMPVPKLIAPEDREMVMERQRARLKGKVLQESYGFRLLHRDGTTRVPVLMSVGTGTYRNRPAVIGTFRDMTKERARESALRESEDKYRTLVESSFDGILIHQDGKVVYLNTAALRLFGAATPEEVTGRPAISFVHPGYRDLVQQRMAAASQGTQLVLTERFLRMDGSSFDADVAATPVLWSGRSAVNVVFRDITDRIQAGEALSESEEKYRELFEESNDAIFITDAATRIITDCNRKAENLTGLTRDELVGTPSDSIHPPELREQTMQRFRMFAEGGESGIESSVLTRDGRNVPVSISAAKITVAGRPFLIGIFRDITWQKQAEEALRLTNRKLNLLSSVTRHDVVNQLTALRGFTVLTKRYSSDPEFLNLIGRQEELMARIEGEILFTREYEEIGMQAPAWQNAEECIRAALADIDLNGIVMKVDDLARVEVFADPLLRKVFFNLMENALRHGGKKLSTIRFSSHETKDHLVISCEDDGAGVPADEKAFIFDQGFGKHTGLGLFLIWEILSITGMTVTETGEPGRGALFGIAVPKGAYRFKGGA